MKFTYYFLVFLTLCAPALAEQSNTPLTPTAHIILSADYLTRSVKTDGRFVYSYLPDQDREEGGYNILRHAGTVYSMVEAYEKSPKPELKSTIERAIEYLLSQTQAGLGNKEKELVLAESGSAKLGGSGLTILALAKYTEVFKDKKYLPQAQKLAQGIKAFQQTDGRFLSKYNLHTNKWDDFVSEYYPGEAIFGLIELFEVDQNPQWKQMAELGAHWLIDVRDKDKPEQKLPHDHWLLYGLNELHKLDPQQKYFDHAMKIARAISAAQKKIDPWKGSYYNPPRSTPTSTRNEGLCAAYQIAKRAKSPDADAIRQTVELGLEFQIQMHIGPEEAAKYKNPARALGGVVEGPGKSRVQIDYVQHSISSLLCWESAFHIEGKRLIKSP